MAISGVTHRRESLSASRAVARGGVRDDAIAIRLADDFRGLIDDGALDPFSLVCKAVSANGQPTVKLSDNANKAMGPNNKIEQYKKIFGLTEQSKENLIV